MKFEDVNDPNQVSDYLAETLGKHLRENERVLWLVPGGSAINQVVKAARQLQKLPLQNLTVTLTDERFGEPGHADSNWLQLEQAGFELPGANLQPVLDGKDIAATTKQFNKLLRTQLEQADYALGFFGIGQDGHTAGILPRTNAVTEAEFAHGYDSGEFLRVTITAPAIQALDEAVVYAVGEAKWPVLRQLKNTLALPEQPAQALKNVPELTIYTDCPEI